MITSQELVKKRVLIIGSNGMLGQRVLHLFNENGRYEIMGASAAENSFVQGVEYSRVDITKKNDVKTLFHKFFPDIVINAAAFTNVDKCESQRELSWTVNVKGTENLAISSWAIDAHMIHLSTDYIYDGKEGPYYEEDIPHPISYYGRTKLASENSLRTSGAKYTIVRSNVLYGPVMSGRPDFVKWVINSLKEGKQIRIVTDQFNNPTYIDDLAGAIINISDKDIQGIFNIAGAEFLSRFDFCVRIADYFNLDKNLIVPIETKDLKQPAPRPLKSGLFTNKAEKILGYKPHTLEETFELIRKELNY